jgi:L-ascorbate metabolism protein UlaG (beta-lactamase superfamily)
MNKSVIIFICFVTIPCILSCKLIKIEVSDKRNPVPQIILLNNNIELSSTGVTRISKSDFFPSCFKIKENGKVIYIDPLAISDTDKADYIFITHPHLDHFSIKDIKKTAKSETLIICPGRVAKKLGKCDYRIKEVKPGEFFNLDNNLKVEVIEAYNLKAALLWLKAHPKSRQNAGYVLDINGVRIYHTGDTDYIPAMDSIKEISVILVPIGGDNLTMNADDAVRLINKMKPKIAVPMHYDMKARNDLERFRILTDKGTEVIVLE